MELRSYQKQALSEAFTYPKRALAFDPRLGKTLTSVEILKLWKPSSWLITAPKTVCSYWMKECEKGGIPAVDGFSGKIKEVIAIANRLKASGLKMVINDDRLHALLKAIPSLSVEALVVDECHRLKGVSSLRGRAYRRLARRAKYIRILSGTLVPNHYGNLWGSMAGLSEEDWGKSYTWFADRYLIRDSMFRNKILGYKNLPELEAKLKKWAHVVRRDDVFGPDTWQIVEREVQLPPKIQKMYRTMAKEWLVDVQGTTVSGTHALTRFLRFQQMTSGFLPVDGRNEVLHTAKIDAVIQDLQEIIESGEKAVLFCRFTWEVETYKAAIEKELKCLVPLIQGSSSISAREEAISLVNTEKMPCVCIVQIQAGSTGISLAGAQHALFASETFSYTEQKQAQDRIYAPNQRKCVTYYRVPNTIDQYIAKTLLLKKSISESVQNTNLEEILLGYK